MRCCHHYGTPKIGPRQVLGRFCQNHSTSFLLRCTCTIERCSSVVPGGVSTRRRSSPPQSTSRNNCFIRPGRMHRFHIWLVGHTAAYHSFLLHAKSLQRLRGRGKGYDWILHKIILSLCQCSLHCRAANSRKERFNRNPDQVKEVGSQRT